MHKKIILLLIVLLFPFIIKAEEINETKENETDIIKYVNKDTNYKVFYEDDANIIINSKIVIEEMKNATKYGNIAFKTINVNELNSTEQYIEKYYHEIFNNDTGTVLLIDMDQRYIYIYSGQNNYELISKDKARIITDNIYTYASRNDYDGCAVNGFKQINRLLEGKRIASSMKLISNGLISLIISFLFGFLITLNKTKIKKANSKELLKKCKIKFELNNINVKETGTRRVYSPVESSGGSSHSGGGFSGGGFSGGGGGFSGGGGGHRF